MPSSFMQADIQRLEDILVAADGVAEFCSGLDVHEFRVEKTVRYAILHSLTIIGEAANRLSD